MPMAEPTICVPVALHASSASPEKLRPMFSSARPVTVPLVAANAVMETLGSSGRIRQNANTNERNRFHVLFISSLPSFLCDFWLLFLRKC